MDKTEIKQKYRSIINEMYNKHHVSSYQDAFKHNEGIINAMVEFAIYFQDQEIREFIGESK